MLKYPVHLNLFIGEDMDNALDELSELMGITKHEYIRFIIGQALAGYRDGIRILQEKVR